MNKVGKIRLAMLLGTMAVGCSLEAVYAPVELHRPLSGMVVASEPKVAVQTIVEPPLNTYKATPDIVSHIQSLFGKDAQNMLTIIGTCENGTFDQTRTNTNRNGTKDWGIAQINDANERLCKGLDFRYNWKDNLTCAHRVYKSQGLQAWSCSHKVGVTPFYLRSK